MRKLLAMSLFCEVSSIILAIDCHDIYHFEVTELKLLKTSSYEGIYGRKLENREIQDSYETIEVNG